MSSQPSKMKVMMGYGIPTSILHLRPFGDFVEFINKRNKVYLKYSTNDPEWKEARDNKSELRTSFLIEKHHLPVMMTELDELVNKYQRAILRREEQVLTFLN